MEFSKLALEAASVDASSDVLDCSQMDNLFVQLTVTASAATLVGTVAVAGGIILPGDAVPYSLYTLTTPVAISTLPANITVAATGLLTFASPAAATHNILLRVPAPPGAVRLVYDFTSGGGTVALTARVFGWKHKT